MTPDQIAELRRAKYNATVVRLVKIHGDLLVMRVRPDFPLPRHRPGQYTVLGLGLWEPRFPGCQEEQLRPGDEAKLGRRSYSISCSVLDDQGELLDLERADWLEFYIVLVRDTVNSQAPLLTPRLFLLREGDPPREVVKASRSRQGQPIESVSRSIARQVVQDKVSLFIPNILEDALFSTQDSILSTGIRSAICAPLMYTQSGGSGDAVIGLIYLDSLIGSRSFEEEDLTIVTLLANLAATRIENARLLEESLEKRRMEDDMRDGLHLHRLELADDAGRGQGIGSPGGGGGVGDQRDREKQRG